MAPLGHTNLQSTVRGAAAGSVVLCKVAFFSDRSPPVIPVQMGLWRCAAAACAILLLGFASLTAVDAQTAASAASSAEAPSTAPFQALSDPSLFAGASAAPCLCIGSLRCAQRALLRGCDCSLSCRAGLEATLKGQFATLKDNFGSQIASQFAGLTSAASNLNFGANRHCRMRQLT